MEFDWPFAITIAELARLDLDGLSLRVSILLASSIFSLFRSNAHEPTLRRHVRDTVVRTFRETNIEMQMNSISRLLSGYAISRNIRS